MLLFNTNLLLDDPFAFFVLFAAVGLALVIGISVHEFSHAAAANLQGDMTATRLGRLTLNPLAHLHPTGTLLIVVVGVGFGRPVPVNPRNLRSGRLGMAFVSAAGPASNLVLALVISGLFQSGLIDPAGFSRQALQSADLGAWASVTAAYAIRLNLLLAFFNLLPVPPLDGGGILAGIAPRVALPVVSTLQRVGPPLLLIAVLLTLVSDVNVLGPLFTPVNALADRLIGG
jgi:Zn-dependent protease